jgi:large subunit ribosomal protein L32e
MPEEKKNKADVAIESTAKDAKEVESVKPSKTTKKAKEDKFTPRAKPELSQAEKTALDLRRNKQAKNPRFRRQEWWRYQKLGIAWRKPRGLHSKMRRHISYRPDVVSIGYRTPKAARGLHPSGFEEVMVHNVKDLEGLNPKKQAIRIGHSVGYLKRMHIAIQADEMKLRILNFNREMHDELLEEAKKRGIELPSKEGSK